MPFKTIDIDQLPIPPVAGKHYMRLRSDFIYFGRSLNDLLTERGLGLNYDIQVDEVSKEIRFSPNAIGQINFSRTKKGELIFRNTRLCAFIYRFLNLESGTRRIRVGEINERGEIILVTKVVK